MARRADPQTPAEGSQGFIRAMGLFPATSLNMAQMVGIGPFITIPLIISAIGGPQVMVGWVIGEGAGVFVVEDLDHAISQCQRLGGSVVAGPRGYGGGRYCIISDPAGAVCAIYQPPDAA